MRLDELFLKSRRNEIFETIQSSGYNPAEFEWSDESSINYPGSTVPKLTHKPSAYYCQLETLNGKTFFLGFAPGSDDKIGSTYVSSFDSMLKVLTTWLGYVKREFEAPDLWAAAYEEKKFAEAAASEPTNAPFSLEEQQYIASQLNEIKEFLRKTHDLTQEKLSFIEDRLSYLEDATKRQGRRDWMHLALGVIFSIILQLALPGETARELLRFMASIFSRIIGAVGFLPQ